MSPITGSGDHEPVSGVLEIVRQGRPFETEVRVDFNEEGVRIILDFLETVMETPGSGFASKMAGLIGQVREELRDTADRFARCEPCAEASVTGVTDPVLKRNWWAGERVCFGLDAMNVINRFLACFIRPPRGCFSLHLDGIWNPLAAEVRAP